MFGQVPDDRRGELSYLSLIPSKSSWEVGDSPERGMYRVVARRDGKQLTERVFPRNWATRR